MAFYGGGTGHKRLRERLGTMVTKCRWDESAEYLGFLRLSGCRLRRRGS